MGAAVKGTQATLHRFIRTMYLYPGLWLSVATWELTGR